MSDDGHRRRSIPWSGEPRQPGPQPAGLAGRPPPGAQRDAGRGPDGAEPAGAVGVPGPAAAALRRRAADPRGQRVPADPAGRPAARAGAAGALAASSGCSTPSPTSTRRRPPGSSRCWSATTASPSWATPSPAARRGGAARAAAADRQHPVGGRPRRADPADAPTCSCCRTGSSPISRTATSTATSGSASSSADNPAVRDAAHGRGPGDPALGGHLPRPDRGHARPRGRCGMRGIEPNVQVVTENFLTVPGLVAGQHRGSRCCSGGWSICCRSNVGVRALPLPGRGRPAGRGDVVAPGLRRRPGARLPAGPRRPGHRAGGRGRPRRYRPR